jgi:LPXTG-motif cell wall-anchored protein
MVIEFTLLGNPVSIEQPQEWLGWAGLLLLLGSILYLQLRWRKDNKHWGNIHWGIFIALLVLTPLTSLFFIVQLPVLQDLSGQPLPPNAEQPAVIRDFAEIWRAADKIVYSRSLESVSSARTRIEREFDLEVVRRLKEGAEHDFGVGGAELAAQAIEGGLVDEYRLFLAPVIVGGVKRALPDGVRVRVKLVEERRFGNGTVYLRYRAR